MQRDPRFITGKASPTHAYEVDGHIGSTPFGGHYTYGAHVGPPFGSALAGMKHDFPGPLNGFELQPSEACPKNFIIFDQTDNKSRVMYHPALADKFSSPSFNLCASHANQAGKSVDRYHDKQDKEKTFSSLKEDTDDIDALLSSEEEQEDDDDDDDEDEDDDDDDMVSTGRTPGRWGCSSPDPSFSMERLRSGKLQSCSYNSTSASSSGGKKEKMRKMVKALRGIIPGGERLDTPAVLDEAVKYLKSLKVEVKKLGIQNLDN